MPDFRPSERWVGRLIGVESFLVRHRKVFLALLAAFLLGHAVRESLSRRYGDFSPVLSGLHRFVRGEPLYAAPPGTMSYLYSPAFAVAFSPLARMPDELARFLWAGLFWGGCLLSWRLTRSILAGVFPEADRTAPGFRILSLLPCSFFMFINGRNGQSTFLIMAAMLAAYRLDLRGRHGWAGAAWAAALLVKPFPLVFLPFFLLRRRWSTLVAAAGTVGAALAASGLFFRQPLGSLLHDWLSVALGELKFGTGHPSVQSVWAVVNRLSGRTDPPFPPLPPGHPADWLVLVLTGVIVAAPCLILMKRGGAASAGAVRDRLAFGLFLIAMTVLPPIGWKHYYLLLLFPGALLACLALRPDPGARAAMAVWLAGTLLLQARLPPWPDAVLNGGVCLFAALAVFGVLAARGLGFAPAKGAGGLPAVEVDADDGVDVDFEIGREV